MRSLLYVPGNAERMIEKARLSDAGGVILDLEDAIAPAQKEAAREVVARILREADFGARQVFVRINGLATPYAVEDARAVAATGGAGILIPKVESVDEIATIAPILASGPPESAQQRRLLCLIESPSGVLACRELAAGSPFVTGVVFGSADLALEIGCSLTAGEPELLYARSQVLLAARAAGVAAYDSPHFLIADLEGLGHACKTARHLGYDGKTVIHPLHIATVNEIFAPTEAEIAEAKRIVAAMNEAAAEGRGAITLDGRLVDQVHLAHAKKILDKVP